jgi:hypothetical protein
MLTATAKPTIVKEGHRRSGLVDHIQTRNSDSEVKIYNYEAKDAETKKKAVNVVCPEAIADSFLQAFIILGQGCFGPPFIAWPSPC